MTAPTAVADRTPQPPAQRHRAGLAALMSAHSLSAAGSAMTIVAVPWLVLETTGSIARTGTVVTVYALGAGVAGFLAGPFVDRWGFKRIGVCAYAGTAAAMGTIGLLHAGGALSFPVLLALVLAAAALTSPGAVALSGLVPQFARAAGTPLERANSGFRAISNVTQLIGPAAGGGAALLIGAHNVLLLDAAAGLLAAGLVAVLVRQPAERRRPSTPATVACPAPSSSPSAPPSPATATAATAPGATAAQAPGGYLAELREGWRIIRQTRLLTGIAATRAAYNLLDGGLAGIVLVSVAYLWWGNPASFGLMFTAFGAGALAGTVFYGAVGHRLPRRPVYLTAALTVGLPLVIIGFAPSLVVTLIALAVTGVLAAPSGPLTATALQETIPRRLYGRAVSTIRVIGASTSPLGIALTAGAVAVFGLRPTIFGMAACYLLIGVACWRAAAFHDLDTARRDAADAATREQKDLL